VYAFEYQRPADLAAARTALAGDARYLAGGQSLVQAMRLRLSRSDTLVDLGGIAELRAIRADGDGVTIGAMATHHAVATHADVRRLCPGLADLAGGIGDPMVRSMGTIGGAVANADPAQCYPTAVLALDATIATDRRTLRGSAFFKGFFETALEPGELIRSVTFPAVRTASYVKFKQPASRFAMVGVFVAKTAAGPRVAVTGCAPCVFRAEAVERALAGAFTPEAAKAAVVDAGLVTGDMHGSAEYRAALIPVIAARAVEKALAH
jgi:carbon-monoxide dehydrogenase medium subunit